MALTLEQRQQKLDEGKWLESEKQGKDTCGKYAYCPLCNKENKFPCAQAEKQFKALTRRKPKKRT